MTHLVSQDSILIATPQISEPIESRHLEVFERAALFDVSRLLSQLDESRAIPGIMCTLVRQESAPGALEVALDRIRSDSVHGVVILPRSVGVSQTAPFAQVLDWNHNGRT